MVEHKCSICGHKMRKLRYVPSALDDIVCPSCGCREIGFFIPLELGLVVVDCRCECCGRRWSVRVDLPKNLFDKELFG